MPTMVIFEGQPYKDSTIDQTKTYIQQCDDDWLMLYTHGKVLENTVSDMFSNTAMIEEQQKLMDALKMNNSQQSSTS